MKVVSTVVLTVACIFGFHAVCKHFCQPQKTCAVKCCDCCTCDPCECRKCCK